MRHPHLFSLLCLNLGLLGCGDEGRGGAGASSSPMTLCNRLCAREAAARCDDWNVECVRDCVAVFDQLPPRCRAPVETLASCESRATFSCDAQGEAVAPACTSQEAAAYACLHGFTGSADGSVAAPPAPATDGGVSSPGGDAGSTGAREAGTPVNATTMDGGPVAPRTDAGAGAASEAGAAPTIPIFVPRTDAGTPPSTPSDPSLACAPLPTDPACESCLKSSCCEEVVACGPECLALFPCVAACGEDDACVEACLTLYPEGLEPYIDVSLCAALTCEACGLAE